LTYTESPNFGASEQRIGYERALQQRYPEEADIELWDAKLCKDGINALL